jgi:UDP-glucuronate decarboxylase
MAILRFIRSLKAIAAQVNPIGIRSCYDEGKRIAETLCFDYQRMNAVEVRVARIFNTYGPRMLIDDGRVVSNFHCAGPPR